MLKIKALMLNFLLDTKMVKKSDHCASSSQEMNGCVNSFKEMKYICIEITKKKKNC